MAIAKYMTMSKLSLVLLLLLLLTGCGKHSKLNNQGDKTKQDEAFWKVTIDENIFLIDKDYYWDINEIILEGKIILKENYGPPNYGENHEEDKLESYYFLIPNNIITYEYIFEDIHEIEIIKEIQIVANPETIRKIYNDNYIYEIFGDLFPAHTGHHHSRILIQLSEKGGIKICG